MVKHSFSGNRFPLDFCGWGSLFLFLLLLKYSNGSHDSGQLKEEYRHYMAGFSNLVLKWMTEWLTAWNKIYIFKSDPICFISLMVTIIYTVIKVT